MSAIDQLLEANDRHVEEFAAGGLEAPPTSGVAIVACMDARVDVYRATGLEPGQAHVIRNAGGVVTPEVVRSLAISEHKLGTTEVMLIGHSKCGLEGLDRDAFAAELDRDMPERDWSIGAFDTVEESVRAGIAAIEESPFLSRATVVRGFVYDVDTGALREVR